MDESIWQATAGPLDLPALGRDMTVDTAIVGGGITGLTTALQLSRAGQRVAVLEASRIGSGTTGHSTGNLYAMIGTPLSRLRSRWGERAMCEVVRARASAVDFIEGVVREHSIGCDFARRAWHLFETSPGVQRSTFLELERVAALQAGLPAALAPRAPLSFDTGQTLVIGGQAQFNPLQYVRGLASAISSDRCAIFENTEVMRVDADRCMLYTAGARVTAARIVMATHTPKGIDLAQTQVAPYREYALAATLRSGDYPHGIFWSAGASRYSIRSLSWQGRQYLIVIGQQHKTGQAHDTSTRYAELETWVRSHFEIEAVGLRWSAQGYQPVDDLPYIGESANARHIHIATGFSADGLTWGTVAGLVLADEILGRPNAFARWCKPTRIAPLKSATRFAAENANVAREYASGYLGSEPTLQQADDIRMGDGQVVSKDGERIAVWRDGQGTLRAVSAVCTHMGCIVGWNDAEQTWDCPCHGSRFSADGTVIEGPALAPLPPVAL